MHVAECMVYEGHITAADMTRMISERIHLLPRYRQMIVQAPFDLANPTWEDDPHFAVANHIAERTLPPRRRRPGVVAGVRGAVLRPSRPQAADVAPDRAARLQRWRHRGLPQTFLTVTAANVAFVDRLIVRGGHQVRPPLPFTPASSARARSSRRGHGSRTSPRGRGSSCSKSEYDAWSSHVVAPAWAVVPIPSNVSDELAAAAIEAYGTAGYALEERCGIRSGEKVLVLGAGGAVGAAAVEVALHLDAGVIALTSDPARRVGRPPGAAAPHSRPAQAAPSSGWSGPPGSRRTPSTSPASWRRCSTGRPGGVLHPPKPHLMPLNELPQAPRRAATGQRTGVRTVILTAQRPAEGPLLRLTVERVTCKSQH